MRVGAIPCHGCRDSVLEAHRNHRDGFSFVLRFKKIVRVRQPESKKGEVDNYVAARFLRRVYTLHYSRPGDEYFRNLDRFTLEKGGWEWINTFERLKQRKSVAYARYFLTNITDDKNVRQPKVEEELWEYYSGARAEFPSAGDKLPDLKATLKERTDSK